MRLDAALIRLPHRFDAATAAKLVDRLADQDWEKGDPDCAVLVGNLDQPLPECREGTMQPTPALGKVPELSALLAETGAVIGRTRLLRLSGGTATPLKHDLDAYWQHRARLIFVIDEGLHLESGEQTLEAPPGSVWLLDGWRGWRLAAETGIARVIVADTVGSAAFWSLVQSSDRPEESGEGAGLSPRNIALSADAGQLDTLETETVPVNTVISAAELKERIRTIVEEIQEVATGDEPALARLVAVLESFERQWQAVRARHGEQAAGREARRQALEQAWSQIAQFASAWTLANRVPALERFYRLIFADAERDESGRPLEIVPAEQLRRFGWADANTESGTASAKQAKPRPDKHAPISMRQQNPDPKVLQDPDQSPPDPHAPLSSVHTRSFPDLLRQIGASLLVTTYQAGKLAILRENQGVINTHFHVYNRPMGLAADNGRLAVGTAWTVEEYRNMADVAVKLDPPERHDAAYLPRNIQITGNIDIHEMAYGKDGLWVVNTRFSCLCTLDGEHSFVPRWRPPFISGYAPEDRCHLNGLEMVDGKPKYVTALGTTDTAGGWRDNKAGGGVLMDVESGEFICRGLSMPHSPRWYDGKLWVLESGNGSLATVDPATGQLDTVVELPGFTRGLDFYGPFAFIGLSQVRESAVFSGIRLTERVDERCCGVWVVDLRSGRIVAFLKFEDAVQEVFAVSVLPGQRYPDVLGVNDAHVPVCYALPDAALAEVVRPKAASNQGSNE